MNAEETDQPCVLPRPCPCCGGRMPSSRPSPPAASPSIGLLRPYRRSGSTPHDDVQPTCSTQCRRCTMLVLDRQCERLLRRGRSTPSGTRRSRLTGSSEPRMAPMRCLVIDHLCSGLNRSRPTTTASQSNRHRARCTVGASSPRLRALQVCRRRPLVCVAASVMAGIPNLYKADGHQTAIGNSGKVEHVRCLGNCGRPMRKSGHGLSRVTVGGRSNHSISSSPVVASQVKGTSGSRANSRLDRERSSCKCRRLCWSSVSSRTPPLWLGVPNRRRRRHWSRRLR